MTATDTASNVTSQEKLIKSRLFTEGIQAARC